MAIQGFLTASEAQEQERRSSESFPNAFVCPLEFSMYDLQVNGTSAKGACPSNSPYIVAQDEEFVLSVIIEFKKNPLTQTLMCLGVPVTITYSLEGFGAKAAELDLAYSFTSVADKYVYKAELKTTALDTNPIMTPGLYEIAAVAEIGGKIGNCAAPIWGHGYVQEALLEVYAAGQD
jgi:hypothetical protein